MRKGNQLNWIALRQRRTHFSILSFCKMKGPTLTVLFDKIAIGGRWTVGRHFVLSLRWVKWTANRPMIQFSSSRTFSSTFFIVYVRPLGFKRRTEQTGNLVARSFSYQRSNKVLESAARWRSREEWRRALWTLSNAEHTHEKRARHHIALHKSFRFNSIWIAASKCRSIFVDILGSSWISNLESTRSNHFTESTFPFLKLIFVLKIHIELQHF